MKRLGFFGFLCLLVHPLFGAPPEEIASWNRLRQETIALLREGKLGESKQRLSQGLLSRQTRVNDDLAVGRQWVSIALHFRARGEWPLARQAANEAVAIATLAVGRVGIDSERAGFLSNVGFVCARVLNDLPRAKAFYEASLVAQPTNQQTKDLLRAADEKIKKIAAGRKG